ncbi:MAG: putative hydrolase or acyltransferase of alpha/beta superfamily [Acidimicrobiales bacterium]|nr:putative hydrolase or acyltransferase of alpha/beta superfamily [Acidimicrobiales bacterium]
MKVHVRRVRDVELSLAEAGVGGSPLLLLHGFTGAKEDFGDWLDPLADRGFHVVAPDLRGHGDSVAPAAESAYSLDEIAADVLALADDLGWPRCALLGHSMGGMVAQVVALAAPGRVERLVLMDTHHGPVPGIEPEVHALGLSIVREQGIAGLMQAIAAMPDSGVGSTDADRRVRAARPGYVEFGERKLRACSPAMWSALSTELVSRRDLLDDLRTLPMPTLVLVGDQDEPFLPASRRMAAAIPHAQLAVLPDAGHSPQFEAPDAWWSALTAFLDAPSP